MTREEILEFIRGALERLNELRAEDERLEFSEETRLYGRQGNLDSLSLAALVVDVEQNLSDATGSFLVLADERALAESRSPFSTLGSFADYVMKRLQESPT